MKVSSEARARRAAEEFVAEAFEVLEREHVIPTPRFATDIRVGRDYFGGTISALSSFGLLERTIGEGFPDRFAEKPIRRLLGLLQEAGVDQPAYRISSFGMALTMFERSHQYAPWFEHIVNLATALEAALIGDGDENTGLSLRLRHRAATLLVCESDSSSAIFGDIKGLYGLRSILVHGGSLTDKRLNKFVYGLSTIPAETLYGTATELAVDRLRDIVRRSILARVSLAHGDNLLWPFIKRVSVDEVFADDRQRQRWRQEWQQHLSDMGTSEAIQPTTPVDAFSREGH